MKLLASLRVKVFVIIAGTSYILEDVLLLTVEDAVVFTRKIL